MAEAPENVTSARIHEPHASTRRRSEDELDFGRPNHLKVFISSKMRGGILAAERAAAAAAIDEYPDAEPWLWERMADAGPYSSLDVCRGNAATSDILLLIVADELTHPTEVEWRAAQEGGVTCAIFVKEGVEQDERLQAFLRGERDSAIYVPFGSVSELRSRIFEMLRRNHTHSVRRDIRHRRWTGGVEASGSSPLIEVGIEAAHRYLWEGSAERARQVIAELDLLVGLEGRNEDLDLVAGLVHGTLGDFSRASEAYWRVVRGQDHTPQAVAIAYQNLGLEAMRVREIASSRELMREALRRHHDNDDWFGVLQVILNMATLECEELNLNEAENLVAFADELIPSFDQQLPHQELTALGIRGTVAAERGRFEEAMVLHRRTLVRSRSCGDRDAECTAAQNIGSTYSNLGKFPLAKQWLSKALTIADAEGNVWRQEMVHRSLGVASHRSGDHRSTVRHFEAAREIAARMDDRWRVATLTADIGAALCMLGEVDRAEEVLMQAAAELEELDDPEWLFRVSLNQSILFRQKGEKILATATLEQALTHAQCDEDRQQVFEVQAFLNLDSSSDVPAALKYFLQSAAVRSDQTSAEQAWLLGSYAAHMSARHHYDAAMALFDAALTKAETNDDSEMLFHLRNDRGLCIVESGLLQEAEAVFVAGVAMAMALANRSLEVQALHNLGETQRRREDLAEAEKSLRRAAELSEELEDMASWRSAMALLALAESNAGELDRAERDADMVRNAAHSVGDVMNEGAALGVLGGIAFMRADYVRASDFYRSASRLNRDHPVHYAEDLIGLMTSQAAANSWPACIRSVQRVVTHAEKHNLRQLAWPSLLQAGRWFLDRSRIQRYATLAVPALVFAILPIPGHEVSGDDPNNESSENNDWESLLEAVMTIALHIAWSPVENPQEVWDEILDGMKLGDEGRSVMSRLVDEATQAIVVVEEKDS